jgi:ribosomal protein S18 acetylase RimI-like enzyme
VFAAERQSFGVRGLDEVLDRRRDAFRQQMNVRIRPATTEDIDFLETMLFEAFFWDTTASRPAFSEFRHYPEFTKQLSGWGRHGDRGVIAEDTATPLGAAWFRLWTTELHSYGFVDASTPELGIGVALQHRRKGVGRALLRELVAMARADRFPALSLSVSPFNPVRRLYESVGFHKFAESGTSWTLRLPLE